MQGLENQFTACEIDPILLTAVGIEESRLGSAYSSEFNARHHNAFGIMDDNGLKSFSSWEIGIFEACGILKRQINKGAKNLDMLGAVYATSSSWSTKVGTIYNKLLHELEVL